MKISEIINSNTVFYFKLDKELKITGLSFNLFKAFGNKLIGENFTDIIKGLFCIEDFCNTTYTESLINKINNVFFYKENIEDSVVLTDEKFSSLYFYTFGISLEFLVSNTEEVILKFRDFEKSYTKVKLYSKVFQNIKTEFDIFSQVDNIAHYIVDYTVDNHLIYGDSNFPRILDIEKSSTDFYSILKEKSNNDKNVIIKDKYFFSRIELLKNGEISRFEDEWLNGDRWLKTEAKVFKRDTEGNCLLLGGIVYDVSNSHKFKDLQYLYTIYELAITSGGIGIFHYNFDKHTKDFFDCNVIYARMLGIKPNDDGLYSLDDFTNSLQPLEDELTNNENVLKSLKNIMTGDIEGTTDDILKIYNKETKEIKYLLSSSKIDVRYDDGTPRRFGGIVIDVTDRINNEKKQIKFAYRDELTRLANNRKLMIDLNHKKSGIGLFFDLDNFKKVNDEYGHLFGDKVLRMFGEALSEVSMQYDNIVPYRLYGDEFFVFAEGYDSSISSDFESKLLKLIDKKSRILKPVVTVKASMGISVLENAIDIDDFIKMADYEMYKTKITKRDKINLTKK